MQIRPHSKGLFGRNLSYLVYKQCLRPVTAAVAEAAAETVAEAFTAATVEAPAIGSVVVAVLSHIPS